MDNKIQNNESLQPVVNQTVLITDEIGLVDIVKVLIEQKLIIFVVTAICTSLAIAASLMLPQIYKVEAVILPPLAESVEKLNIPNIEENSDPYFFEIDAIELYSELIDNIKSNRLQRQYFVENQLFQFFKTSDEKNETRSEDEVFTNEFHEKLSVNGVKDDIKNNRFITITFEGQRSDRIAEWLNGFIKLADEETINAQTRLFFKKVQRVKDSVFQRIESLRFMEQARRLDMIAQLEEAANIATLLGWIERPENPDFVYEEVEMRKLNMSFSLQEIPLYLRGAKVLHAEIDILKERKNDDPFIEDLRNLEQQYNFLSSVKQDTNNVHAMRIDRYAITDEKPIKPKRKLIVAIGFVFGLILSVVSVFIRNVFILSKQNYAQNSL